MKRILSLIIFIFSFCLFSDIVNAEETEQIQKLRAGTFIKVMNQSEFSTLTADIGDEVTFVNTQDMYVYETNAIPENTIFFGEVEDVREPIEGKDGSIKIHVYKMITPDKKVYKISSYIQGDENNYLGGRNTAPAYYHKVPHYINGFKPMLQAAPMNIFQMGKHTVVLPGAELFLILENDVILK